MADTLYYFSSSADKPPGKGVKERVTDPSKYKELASIKDWRRKLSNFWVAPITLEGWTWNTVEHMFQSYKIDLVDHDKAYSFTLESGSQLGKGDGNAARAARKMVILTPEQLQEWESMKETVMENALWLKFTQHPDLGATLLATGDAELWHGARGTPATRQHTLERIRGLLRK